MGISNMFPSTIITDDIRLNTGYYIDIKHIYSSLFNVTKIICNFVATCILDYCNSLFWEYLRHLSKAANFNYRFPNSY